MGAGWPNARSKYPFEINEAVWRSLGRAAAPFDVLAFGWLGNDSIWHYSYASTPNPSPSTRHLSPSIATILGERLTHTSAHLARESSARHVPPPLGAVPICRS